MVGGNFKASFWGGNFLVSATPFERDLMSKTKSCIKMLFRISRTNDFPRAAYGISTLNDRSSFLSSSEIGPWSCKKK